MAYQNYLHDNIQTAASPCNISFHASTIRGNVSQSNYYSLIGSYSADEIFAVIGYELCAFMSLPLSFMLIYMNLTRFELRKPYHFMILSVLILEATLILIFATGQAYHVRLRPQEQASCAFFGFASYASGLSPFFIYALISLQRYFSLFKPELCQRMFRGRNVAMFRAAIWMIASLFQAPYLATGAFGFEELKFCGTQIGGIPWRIGFMLVEANVCSGVTYTICVYCNIRISRRLREHKQRLANKQKTGSRRLSSNVVAEFESIQRMIVIQCVLPLILQMPAQVWKTVNSSGAYPWLSRVLVCVFLIYPALSPYVVIFCLKPYRDAVKQLLRLDSGGTYRIGRWKSSYSTTKTRSGSTIGVFFTSKHQRRKSAGGSFSQMSTDTESEPMNVRRGLKTATLMFLVHNEYLPE